MVARSMFAPALRHSARVVSSSACLARNAAARVAMAWGSSHDRTSSRSFNGLPQVIDGTARVGLQAFMGAASADFKNVLPPGLALTPRADVLVRVVVQRKGDSR